MVQNGVVRGGGGGGERGGGGGEEERKERAWEVVGGEMANCRRYRNPVFEAVGRVRVKERRSHRVRGSLSGGVERNGGGDTDADGAEEMVVKGEGTGADGKLGRRGGVGRERGRVRFEVGGRERDGDEDGEDGGDGVEEGRGDEVRGLVRRLWRGGVVGGGG